MNVDALCQRSQLLIVCCFLVPSVVLIDGLFKYTPDDSCLLCFLCSASLVNLAAMGCNLSGFLHLRVSAEEYVTTDKQVITVITAFRFCTWLLVYQDTASLSSESTIVSTIFDITMWPACVKQHFKLLNATPTLDPALRTFAEFSVTHGCKLDKFISHTGSKQAVSM